MINLFQFALADEDAVLATPSASGNSVSFHRYTNKETAHSEIVSETSSLFHMFGEVDGTATATPGEVQITFNPAAIQVSDISHSQEKISSEMTVTLPRDNAIADLFRIDFPTTQIWLTLFGLSPTTGNPMVLFVGRVRSCEWSEHEAKITIVSIEDVLTRLGCHRKYSRQCPYTLFDQRTCGVNKDAQSGGNFIHRADGTLTGVSADGLTLYVTWTGAAPADGFLSNGYVIIDPRYETVGGVSVPRGGIKRMVSTNNSSTVTLLTPVLSAPGSVQITAYRGCNRQFETCKTVFSNSLNYGGFPHIPQKNPFEGTLE